MLSFLGVGTPPPSITLAFRNPLNPLQDSHSAHCHLSAWAHGSSFVVVVVVVVVLFFTVTVLNFTFLLATFYPWSPLKSPPAL